MEPKRYPRQLSRGANNAVIALSETEAGKVFSQDTRSDIGSEAEKMRFANEGNSLVVKFHRLEANEALGVDMLVMERLYPLDFRAHEVEMREIQFDVFADEPTPALRTTTYSGHLTSPASGSIISCSLPRACG